MIDGAIVFRTKIRRMEALYSFHLYVGYIRGWLMNQRRILVFQNTSDCGRLPMFADHLNQVLGLV